MCVYIYIIKYTLYIITIHVQLQLPILGKVYFNYLHTLYIYIYIYNYFNYLYWENCFNNNKIKLEFLPYNMNQNKTEVELFDCEILSNLTNVKIYALSPRE